MAKFVKSGVITMDIPGGMGFRLTLWPDGEPSLEMRDSPEGDWASAPVHIATNLVVSILGHVMDHSVAYGILHANELKAEAKED